MPSNAAIEHLLTYNVSAIYPTADFLRDKLQQGEQLTIYLGVDPSSPNIHLGHTIVLRKLKEFQQLGHKVIFLIGDFTAMIGDPTGKEKARPQLTQAEVLKNAQTYQEQVSLILDFSGPQAAEIRFNSQWLGTMDLNKIIHLSANFTVQQLLERDMFQKRISEGKPIFLHEFIYPLLQAYDSVALNVDGEIGGTDQTFNMLIGRQLLKTKRQKEKFVLTCPLLVGSDGRKMSKSLGNVINITDPPREMYGKLMALQDDLILEYLSRCTDTPATEINSWQKELAAGLNPMEVKKVLAAKICRLYHGPAAAEEAEQYFAAVFQKHQLPRDLQEISFPAGMKLIDLLREQKLVASRSAAKRLLQQNGVRINRSPIQDPNYRPANGDILQLGRRRFYRLREK